MPEGTRHSRLEAGIGWKDKRIDLDLSSTGSTPPAAPSAPAVARSAAEGRRDTSAPSTRRPAPPSSPGRYLVVVDNVARATPTTTASPAGEPADCGIGADVRRRGRLRGHRDARQPGAHRELTGPATVRAKETATFRAAASDADGTISTYLFDLDGDGTYELDSDGIAEVTTIFPVARAAHDRRPGARRLGRRGVRDARRQRHARREQPDTRPPLSTFRLNRTSSAARRSARSWSPTGCARRRGWRSSCGAGSRLVRLIDRGVRKRNRYYRIRARPAHLKRGALHGADLRAGRLGQAAGRAALGAAPVASRPMAFETLRYEVAGAASRPSRWTSPRPATRSPTRSSTS